MGHVPPRPAPRNPQMIAVDSFCQEFKVHVVGEGWHRHEHPELAEQLETKLDWALLRMVNNEPRMLQTFSGFEKAPAEALKVIGESLASDLAYPLTLVDIHVHPDFASFTRSTTIIFKIKIDAQGYKEHKQNEFMDLLRGQKALQVKGAVKATPPSGQKGRAGPIGMAGPMIHPNPPLEIDFESFMGRKPVVGDTRWDMNTDKILEWDGTKWSRALT